MKKALLLTSLLLFVFLVAASFSAYFYWTENLKAPSTSPEKNEVLIKKGSSADEISDILLSKGLIKNKFVFKLYLRIYKESQNLPPGEFRLPKNLSVPDLVTLLKKGPQEVWVTLPEGLRREQIPDRFTKALNLSEIEAKEFKLKFLEFTKDLEGHLYPDTYLIPKDITPEKVVGLLLKTFDKKFPGQGVGEKDKQEVIVLASIIERETRNDEEKPAISGVMANRIRIGMPLQIDATVQYAKANILCAKTECEDWWPTVYLEDYKLKSEFNTYQITGLPPSPISNPGTKSLEAAVSPEAHEYIYYIHDKEGQIHLAKSLEEHNLNVEKYLR